MPTRRGVTALLFALGLVVAGRLLGVLELYVVGAAVAALVLVAIVQTQLIRCDLVVDVSVPGPVLAGDGVQVVVDLRNDGLRPTPPASLEIPLLVTTEPAAGHFPAPTSTERGRRAGSSDVARTVTVGRGAPAVEEPGRADGDVIAVELGRLAPLEPIRVRRSSTGLRRGRVRVGPVAIVRRDVFGLAERRVVASGALDAVVVPRHVAAAPVPRDTGIVPRQSEGSSAVRSHGGDDFFALRPYAPGDDLRRVHWPSTARLGELLVRQEEASWEHGVVVVCDLRRAVHDAVTFEKALEAAATLVVSSANAGAAVRLLTTDRYDSKSGSGPAHTQAILEHLAEAVPSSPEGLAFVLARLANRAPAALVLVSTDGLAPRDAERLTSSRPSHQPIVLEIERGRPGTSPAGSGPGPGVGWVIPIPPGTDPAVAWEAATAPRHRGPARVASSRPKPPRASSSDPAGRASPTAPRVAAPAGQGARGGR